MPNKNFKNRLNNLSTKEWLKFQKSWFIHNPPPRQKKVHQHPAKFPETLIQSFIEFFTKTNQFVLDPMAGTGSTNIAAMRAGRNCYGIEINPKYTQIASTLIKEERETFNDDRQKLISMVITGDANNFQEFAENHSMPKFDYVITSPPYWNMLHAKGFETQQKRRGNTELDVIYSEDPSDLGNIDNYDTFLDQLISIYGSIKPYLRKYAYITIIVKNIKKGGTIYPLAWDLALRLEEFYKLKDEKVWCQDNIKLSPYGMGNAWVSNTFHHYCLQFRNEF
jgi:DNA modification methylase